MASIVVSGDTSGAVTLSAPSVAGTTTVTLPSSTGTMALLQTPSFATTIGVGGATASASGSGISFPATQSASSDANTLDDYEEGTWTPVFADAATGGNTGTYTNYGSTYTKIGRQVTIQSYMSAMNTTGMTSGNAVFIRGLPFVPNTGGAQGNFYSYRLGRNASTVSSSIAINGAGNALLIFFYTTNSATTDLTLLISNITSGTSELIFSLTYQTA